MDIAAEYHQAMITLLEMISGRDFMSPGGKGNVEKLAGNLDLQGKRVLDIGCGLGGPAFILAGDYGAQVTGIDIETHLIDHAQRRAFQQELGGDRCVVEKAVAAVDIRGRVVARRPAG